MSPRRQERGGVYLLVLVTAGVAMSMGVLAVAAAASQREIQEIAIDRERAGAIAESGIHLALDAIEGNSTWRLTPAGRVLGPLTLDRGQLWVDATDADGSLTDDDSDPFTLTATATFGQARQRVAVDIESAFEPIEALEHALVAHGGVTNTGDITLSVDTATLDISIPLIAELDPWNRMREMGDIALPDPGVIAQYQAMGTVLPQSMSNGGEGMLYEKLLLTIDAAESKADRTAPNADRVYVINGRGGPVLLTDLRLVGTLVVVNATSLEISSPKTMRPSAEGHPLLLTAAPLTLDGVSKRSTNNALKGEDARPTGPDFDRKGNQGAQGLIYVNNNVAIVNELDLIGTLMSTGQVFVSGEANIERNDAYLEAPPPGFRGGTVPRIVAGSWRAVVD